MASFGWINPIVTISPVGWVTISPIGWINLIVTISPIGWNNNLFG